MDRTLTSLGAPVAEETAVSAATREVTGAEAGPAWEASEMAGATAAKEGLEGQGSGAVGRGPGAGLEGAALGGLG